MNLFNSLKAFRDVVEAGGFAAAARHRGVSRAVINKQVQQLESYLGTQLLRRSTRVVTPTETGQAFYQRCCFLLDELETTISEIGTTQTAVKGNLRVNAPMSFGVRYLAPVIAAFMQAYPDIHVELSLNDRFVDLIEEGFDLSVRIAEPEHLSSIVTEPIARTDRILCAGADFAGAHPLQQARDLRSVRCLHYGLQQSGLQWRLDGPEGLVSTRVHCVLWSNNGDVLREAAVRNQGVAMLPMYLIGTEIQQGRLQRVLPGYSMSPLDISVLYPRHRYLSEKIRTLVDFIKQHFADKPPWTLVD